MIYIVHGENKTKSRALILNQQKKQGIDKRLELEAENITPNQLLENAFTPDLFGDFPFTVLNISKLQKTDYEGFISILAKCPTEVTLIIYSESNLPKTNALLKFAIDSRFKIIENSLEPEGNVFSFLDTLMSKNREKTYKNLLGLLRDNMDPFYIFSMINYALRNTTHAVFKDLELDKMKPFVKSKAQAQASLFSESNIKLLYKEMHLLDKNVKTGVISSDLLVTLAVEKVLNS